MRQRDSVWVRGGSVSRCPPSPGPLIRAPRAGVRRLSAPEMGSDVLPREAVIPQNSEHTKETDGSVSLSQCPRDLCRHLCPPPGTTATGCKAWGAETVTLAPSVVLWAMETGLRLLSPTPHAVTPSAAASLGHPVCSFFLPWQIAGLGAGTAEELRHPSPA